MPFERIYNEAKEGSVSVRLYPVRIFGHGIIDFENEQVHFEDGSFEKIRSRGLPVLELLCRNPNGLSRREIEEQLEVQNFYNTDVEDARVSLRDKKPYRILVNQNLKYVLKRGVASSCLITLSAIHSVLKQHGLVRTSDPGSLVTPAVLELIRSSSASKDGIYTEGAVNESELVSGNAIHIRKNLEEFYRSSLGADMLSIYWEQERATLFRLLYPNTVSSTTGKEPALAIKAILALNPEILSRYFIIDGDLADVSVHPYDALTALCFIAIHDCSDFLNLFSGEDFSKLRQDFLEVLSHKITKELTAPAAPDKEERFISPEIPLSSKAWGDFSGEIEIPTPSAYSRYYSAIVCDDVSFSERDGWSFSFDWERAPIPPDTPWASLVYKWDTGQDLTDKEIRFKLHFNDESNFSRVAVEIKKKNEDRDTGRKPAKICERTQSAWRIYTINCDELSDEVRTNMSEICFTVFANYADNKADMFKLKGGFTIKDLEATSHGDCPR